MTALLLAAMLLLLPACAGPDGARDEPLTLSPAADGGTLLTNNADGYSIVLPAGGTVDTSLASVRTAVDWGDIRLYIYSQETPGFNGQASYINYSNTFLDAAVDLTVTGGGKTKVGGCSAVYNLWTRRNLSRVDNDLNHYACFDLKSGWGRVYTLFFKYADGVEYDSGVLPIAQSFAVKKITAAWDDAIRVGENGGPALDAAAQAAYEKIFNPGAPLTWGLFTPDLHTGYEKVKALERALDYEFDIYLLYTGFDVGADGKPSVLGERLYDLLERTCPAGKLPELTLQTSEQRDGLMLYDVLDGAYDGFLRDYAADVAAYGRPVLFRLGNEMNGDWCAYCAFRSCRDADLFVAFYRYIFDIFQQEGADNAIWVFNPNHASFPDFKWNHELLYYPGDAYVNVVGLTAYNTGTYYDGETWSGFNELYQPLYTRCTARYAQPLMITEFACSGIGGDKAAWIDDMFASLPDYPGIKAAVWWSSCDYDWTDPDNPLPARPYLLDETGETLAAFRRGLSGQEMSGRE